MSEKRDVNLYIRDVLESIEKIENYVVDFKNGKELRNDKKTYDAVMMNFVILGEAVNRIYEEVKNNYPDIEWRDIISMRNILVHEYWGVDERVVWDTIKKDLPELKNIILRIKSNI